MDNQIINTPINVNIETLTKLKPHLMNRYLSIFLLAIIITLTSCDRLVTKAEKTNLMDNPPFELIRKPYLQTVFADSASILWKTSNAAQSCYVMYGKESPTTRIDGTVERQRINTMNQVTIKGLELGQKYFYSVYTNDSLLVSGEDYYFYTSPDSTSSTFSFYAMGDIGQPKHRGGFPDVTAYQIDHLASRPDFGIGLGDLIYADGESEVADKYLFDHLALINRNIPFYPTLGNHDWRVAPDQNFEQEWKLPHNEHYYSFAYANAYFIALDSRNGDLYEVEEQTLWFEKTLKNAQNQYDWIFVYLHHNGKTCTYKQNYEAVMRLYPLFAKYNVDLVLNGHAHTYERPHPYDTDGNVLEQYRANTKEYPAINNGFIQITTGAGGKLHSALDVDDGEECQNALIASAFHKGHFSLIEIEGKKLTFKAIASKDGKVYDEFVMDKN